MSKLIKFLNKIDDNTLFTLLVFTSFVVYFHFSKALFFGYNNTLLFLVGCSLLLLCNFIVAQAKLLPEVKIYLRLCSIFQLVYVVASSISYFYLINSIFPYLVIFLSIILLILVLKFEYFLTLPAILILVYKNFSVNYYEFKISLVDYRTLIDCTIYPILFLGVIEILNKFFIKNNVKQKLNTKSVQYLSILIIYFVHLGNYFFSGLHKLSLTTNGGNFFSWIFHNETSNLITVSTLTKQNPITSFIPSILSLDSFNQPNFDKIISLDEINLFMNISTLIVQLGCIFFVTKHILNKFLLISFDISHILIFLFSGIFFYKWIFLNIFFLIFFIKFKNYELIIKKHLVMLIFCMLGSYKFFGTEALAWYDGHFVKRNYLSVKFNDGKTYELPKNIFLHLSITAEQGRLIANPGDVYAGNFGSTKQYDIYKKSFKCDVPQNLKINRKNKNLIEKKYKKLFLKHKKLLEKNNFYNKKISNTFFFPHHIWSNMSYFKYLDNYSFDDIDEIKLELKYLCLTSNKNFIIIDEMSYLFYKNEI
ncbi:hypothetical protein OAL56_00520 [Candidatus Pelagibacter sp.]|nr:hypothetical protein [Candidatus Pelagibacter sp.]